MQNYNDFLIKNFESLADAIERRKAGWKIWKRRLVNNEDYLFKFMAINILLYIWAWLLFKEFALCAYLFVIVYYIYLQIRVEKKCNYQLNPAELKLTSVHEAGHAIVGWALNIKVKLVTTKPENNSFGKVAFMQNRLDFRSELRDEIAMYLGGMVAEDLAFGEHTHGCSQDVKDAIDLAKKCLSRYAMGECFIYKNEEELNIAIDKLLQERKSKAEEILNNNKKLLLALTQELELKRELKGDKVVEFLEKIKTNNI